MRTSIGHGGLTPASSVDDKSSHRHFEVVHLLADRFEFLRGVRGESVVLEIFESGFGVDLKLAGDWLAVEPADAGSVTEFEGGGGGLE